MGPSVTVPTSFCDALGGDGAGGPEPLWDTGGGGDFEVFFGGGGDFADFFGGVGFLRDEQSDVVRAVRRSGQGRGWVRRGGRVIVMSIPTAIALQSLQMSAQKPRGSRSSPCSALLAGKTAILDRRRCLKTGSG